MTRDTGMKWINSLTTIFFSKIETNQLICKLIEWFLYDENTKIDPFHATDLFPYHLKTSENL